MAGLNARDDDIPQPVAVPEGAVDKGAVVRPDGGMPVWVRVRVDDGTEQTEPGFALGWTREHVHVQVLWQKEYFRGARDFWVEADRVTRRKVEPSRR